MACSWISTYPGPRRFLSSQRDEIRKSKKLSHLLSIFLSLHRFALRGSSLRKPLAPRVISTRSWKVFVGLKSYQKRKMYQPKVDVDKLNAVKVVVS